MRLRLIVLCLGLAVATAATACSGSDGDGEGSDNFGSPLATQPPVSEGGGTDAFLIYREASGDLIAHNLASGDRYRQEVDFNTEIVVNVQCTRDGSRLAYLRQVFGETDRKLDIHGEDPSEEPISIPNTVQGISWSPDGTQMAIAEYDGFDLVHTLSILDLASGESTELSTGEDFAGSIAWSPDGETLAYYLQKLEAATTHVYTLPVEGGEPTQITQEGDRVWYDPDWSPDGQSLLVSGIQQEDYQLYEVDVETREERKVTESNIFKRGARFSPDGSTIAYTGSVVEPQVSVVARDLHSFGIFLLNSDGGDERAFTADPRENPGANVDPNLDANFMAWCAPGPWLDDLWTEESTS